MSFLLVLLPVIAVILYFAFRKRPPMPQPDFAIEKLILQQHVLFYQKLSATEKTRFEKSLQLFLQRVRITGVDTTVEDMDSVFVGAAAIIPIFAFEGWEYTNIHEVLLYPNSFSHDYKIEGGDRNILGMVGDGPMRNTMILSQQDLRNGFLNHTDKSNTAIHEFVHLVDKTDGSTDGLPEVLLQHEYAIPWLKRIHEEIGLIESGDSDIDPYAVTNEAEFLAVAAEYFFEQPQLMEKKHPQLFHMLQQLFMPATSGMN